MTDAAAAAQATSAQAGSSVPAPVEPDSGAMLAAVRRHGALLRALPLGAYVHIPFCHRKCHYCDFNTYAADPAVAPVQAYVSGLLDEAGVWGRALRQAGATAQTLFLGGGTPTFLPAGQLERLLTGLGDAIPLVPAPEVTVEANPGTLDRERLSALRRGGVTRLSMGLQAWQDHHLHRLGRDHDHEEFVRTYRAARRAGFDNINIDLMYALPGQTRQEWRETLDAVVGLAPEHVSCYSLIIEEETPFGAWHRQGLLHLPGEEAAADMFEQTVERLTAAGYLHYEIANFARPGRQSRHNSVYWQNGFWLGLGAGAHGQVPGFRWENLAGPQAYMDAVAAGRLPLAGILPLTREDQEAETAMLQLRLLKQGLDDESFRQRFGRPLAGAFPQAVQRLLALGLIERRGRSYSLTSRGLPVANTVFRAFL